MASTNTNSWFKVIPQNPFVKICVNGYDKLSKEFRDIISGFCLKEIQEDGFYEIHLFLDTPNDKEILEMIVKEFLSNDFQELK